MTFRFEPLNSHNKRMSTGNSTPKPPKPPGAGDLPLAEDDAESLVAQLHSLYSERERLFTELGVSDADSILKMINSLTAQLEELYKEREDR